jgi:hypothetical protein
MLGSALVFSSCKKEGNIGENIQPTDEIIDLNASDTTSLMTVTMREDSVRSDENSESRIVQIGSVYDPIFGKSTAGLFTQFVIPNNLLNINFGSSAVLDSSVLSLSYSFDYYGDTTHAQTFNVYQMTEDIHPASIYYSNQIKQCYPSFAGRIPVGDTTLVPHPRSATIVGTHAMLPNLRIPINYAFASQIFNQSGGANLASNTNFLQYLKGLYITSETPGQNPGEGALLHFNPVDSLTRFTFYYHTSTDTLTFSFVINSSAAYYSYFTHDYSTSGGSINAQLSNPNSNSYSEVYVQSCAGLKTKIEFPFVDDWKNLPYHIAINKAEIIIKAEPANATSDFPINKSLYLESADSLLHPIYTYTPFLLPDMFENSIYYGGGVNTVTSQYAINIARYFQEVVDGKEPNNGLFLKEYSPVTEGRRAVFGSANSNSGYKMYLHLVYTRIN